MSTAPTTPDADPGTAPAVSSYQVMGLAAVVVMGVALLQYGAGRWAVIPTLVGAAGLAFRWRSAPLVMLIALTFTLLVPLWIGGLVMFRRPASPVGDLVLCGAVLAYYVAQYRLFGMTVGVFPPRPRRLEQPPPRDPERVPGHELPAALVTVAAVTVAASFLWTLTGDVLPPWGIPPGPWRLGLLAWGLVGALVLVRGVTGHLGWRRLTPDEAALFVRDVLWQETRGEQRRINRWRTWGRQRRQRRE